MISIKQLHSQHIHDTNWEKWVRRSVEIPRDEYFVKLIQPTKTNSNNNKIINELKIESINTFIVNKSLITVNNFNSRSWN